jgi:DNA repair protein RecN (Recombination protein N)
MLQSLHVKNLALIEEAEVEFEKGLNILSGETGAGKSIIIGSINLALGEKVQKEMLRDGEENALVELLFYVEDERQKKALEALEIFPEDDTVILTRKITAGRGTSKINGESVPASKVKEAAALLIDIHGQHEHQSLLSKRKHLEILDDYGKEQLEEPKRELAQLYREYRKVQEELSNAGLDEGERLREISLLEYEIEEIEAAALHEGEDEQLENDYRRFSNGRKILEAAGIAYQNTAGEMDNASDFIGRALRELSGVAAYDDRLGELEGQLADIDNLLNDFNRELSDYLEETEFDEETFYEMEKRLDELNRLKTKYGHTITDVVNTCEEKKQRLEKLQDYSSYLEELRQKEASCKKELEQCCAKVSSLRQTYAKTLTEAVTAALKDLNFLDVRFDMHFERTSDYTANGYDDAEFLISTNPGEPLKPLGKVASGGELSRIMLAIKTVLADQDAVETLIFDEIDSGISGRTAQMVSEKMNLLGRNHQIICITHLPQIAAMADAHYLIEKSVQNQNTVSTIRKLTRENSVSELARMLGGVEITDKVRESAREMKELAEKKKA